MMTKEGTFWYGEHDDLQILELSYAGGDLAMIVLLPKKADGLVELETILNIEKLEKWMDNLRRTEIRVFLPKFKICQGFKLNDALVSMGMADAFDMDKADFSGMNGNTWLYLAAVLHKAFIDVNEAGTEAAAATATVIRWGIPSPMPPPVSVFRTDHPFLFLIYERSTRSILFLGRVVNPSIKVA